MLHHLFHTPDTRRWLKLSSSLALSLLLFACQPATQPPSNPPSPSAFPQVDGTPPPIPVFPAETLPTARPQTGNRDSFGGDAAMAEAPMPAAPGGAAADGAGGGDISTGRPAAPSSERGESASLSPIIAPEFPGPQPQAGLLTAGEWDDLANWPFWLNLLQNQEWSRMPTVWGLDTRQRISVMVRDADGKPLADMPLSLQASGQQTPVFQARTNTQGRAELFASLTTEPNANTLQVVLETGSQNQEQVLSLPVSAQQSLSFTVNQSLAPAVFADLMLVVDTTGSMGDELEYLKQELQNVATRIAAQNRQDLTLRLSANFYRDTTDEYIVRSFPFTTDVEQVRQQLSAQSADGGGDFPEAVDLALADAVDEHQWSPTARARLLFLVLDAPPHQRRENLQRLQTGLKRAAAKGIRIIPVASSGIDKETEFLLRMMAITTGGRYVFLTDHSGIGGSHIEPTVGAYTVEKLNDLMVRIASEYISGDVPTPQPQSTQNPQTDPQQQ